jgi:UDP-glucose 4-epimerase
MRIIVTGGNGFIGSHLIDQLLGRGCEVVSYDLCHPKYNEVETIIGSVLEKDKLEKAIAGCDFVFHLAGMLGTHELVDCAIEATQVNVIGTLNVLEACRLHGVKLVEISKPNCWVNTYTITKIAAESFTEMYRREHGVKATTIKWFNVYGGRQPLMEEAGYKKMIPTAIVNALRGEDIEVYGNGEQTMDLVHTIDTVEATLAVMDNWHRCEGNIFEIGVGEEITVNQAINEIVALTGSCSKIVHAPMRKGETDNTRIKANLTQINFLADWSPRVSLKDGLIETIGWYKDRYGL